MHFRCAVVALLGAITTLAQRKGLITHVTLVHPVNRYTNPNLSLPAPSDPALQIDFDISPDCGKDSYSGSGRLQGRRTLITDGDSWIGCAVVIAFLRERANGTTYHLPGEESDA